MKKKRDREKFPNGETISFASISDFVAVEKNPMKFNKIPDIFSLSNQPENAVNYYQPLDKHNIIPT